MHTSEAAVLIIDPSEEDRRLVTGILQSRAGRFIEAADAAAAWVAMQGQDRPLLMVANIDAVSGKDIFDLRDHLHRERGFFPSVFCSREDMTDFYPRILERERLFFKPVDRAVLVEWYDSVVQGEGGDAPETAAGESAPSGGEATGPAPSGGDPAADAQSVPEENEGAESPPAPLPEETLPVGTRLGDYKLLREIQRDNDFALYEAEQTSIGRRVALKTLYRKHRKDLHWVQGFVNEASARASVNHPSISLVYECDQELGVNFYTLELVDAPSLSDLARRRAEVDDSVLWKVLSAASDALIYLRDHEMSHRLFTAQSILVVKGGEPRIANPVRGRGLPLSAAEERQQMGLLADAISPFLKRSVSDPALYSLIDRMGTDRIDAINSIEGLRRVLNPPDPKEGLSQAELAKITEKETNRTALIVGSLIGALIVAAGIIVFVVMGSKPEVRNLETFIKIPAGKFPFQNKGEVDLPEFWMGRHEVTVAEYARFLDDLAAHPETAEAIRHPDQPADKVSYLPKEWDKLYAAAQRGRRFLGGEIDPNCPVMGVDFWDASAYAKWRGGRLPTEEEWEKAARGGSGSVYPWGDELVEANFNSGLDHESKDGVAAGSIDGYKYWCPVDAIGKDESRYGVIGLAGNVGEWTATWDVHPDFPDRRVPLKRGASFATTAGFDPMARRAAENALERNYFTGIRIAADRENPESMASPPAADGAAPISEPNPEANSIPAPPSESPAPEPVAAPE